MNYLGLGDSLFAQSFVLFQHDARRVDVFLHGPARSLWFITAEK